MTDIAVHSQAFQVEDLSWDLTPPDGGFDDQGTLTVANFTQAQHFPNGYIPSGTVLGIVTATGELGPYLDAAVDGRTTAVGILKASVTVVNPDGSLKTKVGAAFRVHGIVKKSRLPFTSGNAANGGYIDAAGQANLPLIYFKA
jgi:hypothetical protein